MARALYKQSKIILADEPTSGLDATNAKLIEDILVNIIEYETHSVARQQSIGNITQRGAYTGHKTIPTPFVQSTLNTQYSYGAQRCRYDNTYYEPFP